MMKLATTLASSALFAHFVLGAQNFTVQAGYHVIYSYTGETPPADLYTYIEQGMVGGVVIFGGNVNDSLPETIAGWQSTYANSPAYAGSPLLIMTDQEGGEVSRLPGGPTSSEKEIGESTDPEQAAMNAGTQAAKTLTT